MDTFIQDLKYGARMLWKAPGFTTIAVLALALGIGANSAIFTVVNAVLLRPLPYPEADRLIYINEETPQLKGMSVSYLDLMDWRAQSQTLEQIAGSQPSGFTLIGADRPEQLSARAVSANFLDTLRLKPMLGRFFSADEDKPGAAPVAVISYALWERRFSSNPQAVGSAINLSGRSYTIVGVLPKDFLYRQGEDAL